MASGTSAIYSRVVALRLSQRNRTAWLLDLDLSGSSDAPSLGRVANRSGWMFLYECFDELAQSWL